jgi:hypothetical protein
MFVVAFFTLLALPPLQALVPLVKIKPLEEKRRFTPVPDVFGKFLRGDRSVSADINAWFDDHIGFRPLLVRIKHQIDWSVFDHADKVLVGRNGFLYSRGFVNASIRIERRGENLARRIHARLQALARYLAKRDIRLIILSNPMKSSVYPQFLPSEAPSRPRVTQYELLRKYLQRAEWTHLDGQELLSKCGDYVYFHYMDIHNTPPIPYCYAKELVRAIAEAEHRPSPWNEEFKFEPVTIRSGDLVDFLELFSLPGAQSYFPNKIYDTKRPFPEGTFAFEPAKGYPWIYHANEAHRAGKLPRTVLFGNSFSDHFLSAGIFKYFEDFYRGWGTGVEFNDVLPNLPPGTRYFIFQFWEPLITDILEASVLQEWEPKDDGLLAAPRGGHASEVRR